MNDKEYWSEYYTNNPIPKEPSTFAKFILPKLDKEKKLIELGCGNGRDSIYFSKNNIHVIAVDQVSCEIDYLNKKYKNDYITFIAEDFTDLTNTENTSIKNTKFDYIYSRFTFHSINEKKENKTIDWIGEHLKTNGLFLLEARSIKDPMLKKGNSLSENENFTNHYRRYMQLDKIKEKLESKNLEIIYEIENNDLAVYKDDNPVVIRIIAKKN